MQGLTVNEANKVREITQRLSNLSSPVLKLQAILQFSQIVDMLALGDTSIDEHRRIGTIINEIDRLNEELDILTGNV